MRDGRWAYTIRAYRPPNQGGGLAIETLHATEASRDTEIAVFKTRMARCEIGHIEILSHVEPFGVVIMCADGDHARRQGPRRPR